MKQIKCEYCGKLTDKTTFNKKCCCYNHTRRLQILKTMKKISTIFLSDHEKELWEQLHRGEE